MALGSIPGEFSFVFRLSFRTENGWGGGGDIQCEIFHPPTLRLDATLHHPSPSGLCPPPPPNSILPLFAKRKPRSGGEDIHPRHPASDSSKISPPLLDPPPPPPPPPPPSFPFYFWKGALPLLRGGSLRGVGAWVQLSFSLAIRQRLSSSSSSSSSCHCQKVLLFLRSKGPRLPEEGRRRIQPRPRLGGCLFGDGAGFYGSALPARPRERRRERRKKGAPMEFIFVVLKQKRTDFV